MTRLAKLVAVACCAVVAATTIPADAATPGAGSLSKSKKSVSWKGASATLSSPMPDPSMDCNLISDPFCDHFALKIDLGEGAKISLQIKGADPSNENNPAKPYNDFDVFIYAPGPAAAPIATGTSPSGNETVTFTHRAKYRKQTYDIAVRPWLVLPGASYKGSVKAVTVGR